MKELTLVRAAEFPHLDGVTVQASEILQHCKGSDRKDGAARVRPLRTLPQDTAMHDPFGEANELGICTVNNCRRFRDAQRQGQERDQCNRS
jgi:hypothetical protein